MSDAATFGNPQLFGPTPAVSVGLIQVNAAACRRR